MGIVVAVPRIGEALTSLISPILYNLGGINLPLIIGLVYIYNDLSFID